MRYSAIINEILNEIIILYMDFILLIYKYNLCLLFFRMLCRIQSILYLTIIFYLYNIILT